MLKKIPLFLGIVLIMALLFSAGALAAQTPEPDPDDITVTNNLTGTPDRVDIASVNVGDIIRVYASQTGGASSGATVATGVAATVYVNQLGAAGGTIYVTVASGGNDESDRAPVPFTAEGKATPPTVNQVDNNVTGILDAVTVGSVAAGDVIRVYPNSVSPTPLGVTVSDGATATVYISQLGISAGKVYVSVQGAGLESDRVQAGYTSEISDIPVFNPGSVVNNFYTETGGTQDLASFDSVTVPGVAIGDEVKIYKDAAGSATWAVVTVDATNISGSDIKIDISQLGAPAGRLYVTIKKPNKAESKRVNFSIPAEAVTPTLALSQIEVKNKFNSQDTLDVTGLAEGDKVIVYSTATGPATLGTGTVAVGNTAVQIDVGNLTVTGGTIHVTLTSLTANESMRLAVKYGVEDATDPLSAGNVKITNACNQLDTALISNVKANDIIRFYKTLTSPDIIGTNTSAGASVNVTLDANALSPAGGSVFVTIQSGSGESKRTAVSYIKEPVADKPALTDIDVTNNYQASDLVVVDNLPAGAKLKVYLTSSGGSALGTWDEAGGTATATIDDGDLSAKGGKLYVTVTWTNANESPRVQVSYTEEATTDAPLLDDITVTNNYLIADTLDIEGVADQYIIKIFDSSSQTAAAKITVTATGATETIPLGNLLSAGGGKIYISVKHPSANESARTTVPYAPDKTPAPVIGAFDIKNNYVGTDDTVKVSGVKQNDEIRIYTAAGGTGMWTAAPVTVPDSSGSVTITIPQIGQQAGKVFVSVKEVNKAESARTTVPFSSEPVTTELSASSISVENNFNDDDKVLVTSLTANQIVTLYTAPTGGTMLASVTAAGTSVTFYLDDGLLAAGGSKVFVTVKDSDKLESIRTGQTYTSETTTAPKLSNILVVNYPGIQYDTVTIVGLTAGDTVTVYDAATGGNVLVSRTVTGKGTTITLDANLPDTSGKIYIAITSSGKAESKRTAVTYQAA